MITTEMMGTENVKKLIFNLGWPAALTFTVSTIYNLTDVIFVGRWLGSSPIAAVVVVGTITLLFSSVGLAIGIGGASIIARALGEKDKAKAACVFDTQNILIGGSSLVIVLAGWLFEAPILRLFGAQGEIYAYASAYYRVLLLGMPLFSWSTMANMVLHTEGKAKAALYNNLVPTAVNLVLNPVLILGFGLGIAGSAWATVAGYLTGFLLVLRYFTRKGSQAGSRRRLPKLNLKVAGEIVGIGGSVLVHIVASNLFIIVLNQILFKYAQESGVVTYGIINRVLLLFLIPMIGLENGIRPVIGYNFGSQHMDRVRDTVHTALKYGLGIGGCLLAGVLLSADYLVYLFTDDPVLVAQTPFAIRIVFLFFPLFVAQLILNVYFQAIGRPQVAFYLTLLRNLFLLIPLLYLSSAWFGYLGVLYTFPLVDLLMAIPVFWLLRRELNHKLNQRVAAG